MSEIEKTIIDCKSSLPKMEELKDWDSCADLCARLERCFRLKHLDVLRDRQETQTRSDGK
jgi:hypothetical protein